MPTAFRPNHPDQDLLLPSNLRDWLPERHPAQHVSKLVDGSDLTAFYARRREAVRARRLGSVLADAGYCNEAALEA